MACQLRNDALVDILLHHSGRNFNGVGEAFCIRTAVAFDRHTVKAKQDRAVVIVVEDDGPGLPEAERNGVLARGQRLDETTPGHGLGLAIVREIVEGLGDWLHLDRSPMGGLAVEAHFATAQA